jgi:hypothetical protein
VVPAVPVVLVVELESFQVLEVPSEPVVVVDGSGSEDEVEVVPDDAGTLLDTCAVAREVSPLASTARIKSVPRFGPALYFPLTESMVPPERFLAIEKVTGPLAFSVKKVTVLAGSTVTELGKSVNVVTSGWVPVVPDEESVVVGFDGEEAGPVGSVGAGKLEGPHAAASRQRPTNPYPLDIGPPLALASRARSTDERLLFGRVGGLDCAAFCLVGPQTGDLVKSQRAQTQNHRIYCKRLAIGTRRRRWAK